MLTAIVRRVLLVIPNIILLTALLFWSVFSLRGTAVEMMPRSSASHPEARSRSRSSGSISWGRRSNEQGSGPTRINATANATG